MATMNIEPDLLRLPWLEKAYGETVAMLRKSPSTVSKLTLRLGDNDTVTAGLLGGIHGVVRRLE